MSSELGRTKSPRSTLERLATAGVLRPVPAPGLDLLADHRYRQAAAATRAALDRLPDVESAVDLLESLAGLRGMKRFLNYLTPVNVFRAMTIRWIWLVPS
jgi:hypothetical protein